jgi:hypothetical protein
VSDVLDPVPLPARLDLPVADWHQTPTSVRHQVLSLLKREDALEARCHQDSSNSSRPPATDTPTTKRHRRMDAAARRQPGTKPGPPGPPLVRREPTASVSLFPEGCAWGQRGFAEVPRDHTQQVIALPVMRPIDVDTLTEKNCKRTSALPIFADLDGFTRYV